MAAASLRVPVELRRAERWFRMASAISPEDVSLSSEAPEQLSGAIEIAFHLPGDTEVIRCHAKVHRSTLRFLDIGSGERLKIEDYVVAQGGANRG